MKSILRLKKFVAGGKVKKYFFGDLLTEADYEAVRQGGINFQMDETELLNYENWLLADQKVGDFRTALKMGRKGGDYGTNDDGTARTKADVRSAIKDARQERRSAAKEDGVLKGRINAAADNFESSMSSPGAKMGMEAAIGAIGAVDNLTMGDKNFGALSEAIDSAVHAASGALMKSGNPYAMLAGVALEGANFLTKAGGQTVQGFDVDISSSGYGQMGHMESSSSRSFLGLGNKNLEAKLKKRNALALMAMNAANIANELSFELEARANSILNTIMNNNIALAGGLDTSLLGG